MAFDQNFMNFDMFNGGGSDQDFNGFIASAMMGAMPGHIPGAARNLNGWLNADLGRGGYNMGTVFHGPNTNDYFAESRTRVQSQLPRFNNQGNTGFGNFNNFGRQSFPMFGRNGF